MPTPGCARRSSPRARNGSIWRTTWARSVRCDPGKIYARNLAPTVASYKALAEHGASKDIFVIIENHGGVGSERPEEFLGLFKLAGKNDRALPDFGNFPDEATRQKGLKLLFLSARRCAMPRA